MWKDNRRWTFFMDEVLLSIIDWYFDQKLLFKVKKALMMDLFLKSLQLFISEDVNWWIRVVWSPCGLLWCFYQLFGLSFWRHPFTAEHPLLSKRCNATFLQICLDSNSSTHCTALFWVHVHWMNYSFNIQWIMVLTVKMHYVPNICL